ncbi:MAG TPA: hypothetical protein VH108_07145 [Gaiellaceae bacterium]|jgi:hypothetical protein|nr:hypothetical protein [Gaiellaceae bacterium]
MSDDQLTDAWESLHLVRAVTHEEHVRISWVLITRHGSTAGCSRIAAATLANCIAMDARDRFDPALTARWSQAISAAMETSDAITAGEFLDQHPKFLDSRLFGVPEWMAAAT